MPGTGPGIFFSSNDRITGFFDNISHKYGVLKNKIYNFAGHSIIYITSFQ